MHKKAKVAMEPNKTAALRSIFPAKWGQVLMTVAEEFVEQLLARKLRSVLLAPSYVFVASTLACALHRRDVHTHIQVVMTQPVAWAAADADAVCGDAVAKEALLNGGWVGLWPEVPDPSDDLVINRYSGGGRSDAGSYDFNGNAWVDNGQGFEATPGCSDDDAAVEQSSLLRQVAGTAEPTCADVVRFGQTRRQPYVLLIAEHCPVAACQYNSRMVACRLSCACRERCDEAALRHELRCEGTGCRPRSFSEAVPYPEGGLLDPP